MNVVAETAVLLLGTSNLVLVRDRIRSRGRDTAGRAQSRPPAPRPEGTMTRAEAAAVLEMSARQVRRLGRQKKLTDVPQPGRETLVTAESVRKLAAARRG